MQYVDIQIVHSTAYAALLRIQSLVHGTRHPLPWPSLSWTIDVLEGADVNVHPIDYRMCYIPRSLNMRREVYKTATHMIFSNLQQLNQPCIKPSNIIPCSVSIYIQMLHRSRSVVSIHKALANSKGVMDTTVKSQKSDPSVNIIDKNNRA